MNPQTNNHTPEFSRRNPTPPQHSSFGFRISNFIRHSSFGFRTFRARGGSVLIIVIVLLLLLAILGAAYISTTRSARVTSSQNVLNADVDTMVNGIAKACEGVIADDLNDTFGNLHANTAYTGNTNANRTVFQGQANLQGHAPPTAPNSPPVTGSSPTAYSYSPGDIVEDPSNQNIFYSVQGGGQVTISSGSSAIPVGAGGAGWQPMNGHLPFVAIGADPWIADRIPDPAGTNVPVWTALTQTIQLNSAGVATAMSILGTSFEDPTGPFRGQSSTVTFANPLLGGSPTSPKPLTPTFVTTGNTNVPAITNGGGTPASTFVAGDADGDGIADSLLFRIPGANFDGLTWYAAVRIIDNNSAINANTAWSRDNDYIYTASGGSPPSITPAPVTNTWGLFPASVGLQELINTGDYGTKNATPNLDNLNAYRFNDPIVAANHPVANYDPFDETVMAYGAKTNAAPTAFDRGSPVTGAPSFSTSDYDFYSEGEAFYQQFIQRIANPGYNTFSGGTPPTGTRYQALPLSDEAALAYRFFLVNPNTANAASVIETLLPNSLWNNKLPSAPYDASQTAAWFANFQYPQGSAVDALALPLSLRPLLVTRNPVSNYIQQVYNNAGGTLATSDPILPNYMLPYGMNSNAGATAPHFRGGWSSTASPAYAANDVVIYSNPSLAPNAPGYTFIATAAPGATAPATFTNGIPVANLPWQLQPMMKNAVKTDINTATFRELFRAFWCVMAGNPSNATPFGSTGVDNYNIYDSTPNNPQMEFRSPLRDPFSGAKNPSLLDVPVASGGNTTVTNTNTMLLRAALAAVNALGLRDNSQNIVSRTIDLVNNAQVDPDGTSAAINTPVELQVYSSAPEPIISEVFADTDPSDPNIGASAYVAVELYNPYSVPMTLVNWQLGLVNRGTAGNAQYTNIYPNLSFQTNPPYALPAIPPPAPSVSVIGPASGQVQALNTPPNQTPGTSTAPPPPGVIIIPPHGYALLENYNGTTGASANSGDALGRPTGSGLPPNGPYYGYGMLGTPTNCNTCDVYVQNLQMVVNGATGAQGSVTFSASTGGELVLLRPRQINGLYTSSGDLDNTFNEGTGTSAGSAVYPRLYSTVNPYLADLVPVDSYDFTGLKLGDGHAWSYIRPKCGQTVAGANPPVPTVATAPYPWFKGIFPGFYSVTNVYHELGTGVATATGGALGIFNISNAAPIFGNDFASGSYLNNFPPIQIYNVYYGNTGNDVMHFPNSVSSPQHPTGINAAGTPYLYPLGGFARNGDMLDVPFIGSYRVRIIQNTTGGGLPNQVYTYSPYFLELNSLPMDASLAAVETGNQFEDAAENIGRFMPMSASQVYTTAIQTNTPPGGASFPLPDYYSWTRNLFNYLTVQSPSNAHLPNFDTNVLGSNASGTTFAYPPQNAGAVSVPPTPLLTSNATASDQTSQDAVGVDGLININTASWKVLSMLPMITKNEDANYIKDNQSLARAIVAWRLTHGPFTSIFDLNNVVDNANTTPGPYATAASPPGFQNAEGYVATTNGGVPSTPPTNPPKCVSSLNGLMSPPDSLFPVTTPTYTGVAEDYQSDCAMLSRISNLITTRSDTFTIYIEVQGWQNANSPSGGPIPQPVVTRRYAFIVDRSGVNADPTSRFLKTLAVPNN